MFRRIFLRRFFSPSFRPSLRPGLISPAPANVPTVPQTRTASSWSKIVDAVKGKDLPTKRVDNVEISKGAVEGAREAEVLAAFQVGATGGQDSSSGNSGGSSSRSAPFPTRSASTRSASTPSASSPREKDRRRHRRNRSVTAKPGSLSHTDGHLHRPSARKSQGLAPPSNRTRHANSTPISVKNKVVAQPETKANEKLPGSPSRSTNTPLQQLPTTTSDTVVPTTDHHQVSDPSTSSPAPAPTTSDLGQKSPTVASHLKPSNKAQRVSGGRSWSDNSNSVELEPKFPRSASSPASSTRVNRAKPVETTYKTNQSGGNFMSHFRGKSKFVEGGRKEQVQAVPKEPSPVTVASSPSPPPPVKPSSSITLNPQVLQQWENLRKQESWMHPQSKYPYSYMVNPSTGLNHFFRSSQSPISRRAQLHASHLHKVDWIRSYRTKQDALVPPTKEVLQGRLLIDTKIERARQLDDRLLTAKEAWIKEQQLTHKVEELNRLMDTLKQLRDDSLRWHRTLERDATREGILRSRIDTLIAEETRIRNQPSTFPPPTSQPAHWSFANSPVKALRFADRDRTKTYDVLFSELNKSQPQGPSVRDLDQLENTIVRRQREVASLFNEISGHGWRSLE